jgi:dipeptidyl aminopeptidase/acylaminoacyl peptidase
MSRFDRIETRMPQLLTEIADPREPDYFETVVGRTRRSRQRPAWTFPERWLPMSLVSVASTRRSVPWMAIALALVAIALLAGALLVGSARLRPTLPAPFGPAGPGLVIHEAGGDIVAVDPATGTSTTLVAGSETDTAPRWSPDGTRFAFRRSEADDRTTVWVADADGSDAAAVTEPLHFVSDHLFSPDGQQLLIMSTPGGRQAITIVDLTDGSTRDVGVDASLPSFRPPAGDAFVFVTGTRWSSEGQGLSVYDMASGTIQTIVEPIPYGEIVGRPEYSPDGSRLAFAVWVPSKNINSHVIVANADGSNQRPWSLGNGVCCEAAPTWSNDGTRLALTRWYDPMREVVAVVPWAMGGVGQEFDVPGMYRGVVSWSPDDEWLLVTPQLDEHGIARQPQVRLELATGRVRDVGWTTTSDPSIQRLAP